MKREKIGKACQTYALLPMEAIPELSEPSIGNAHFSRPLALGP